MSAGIIVTMVTAASIDIGANIYPVDIIIEKKAISVNYSLINY